ncbi:MAG: S8 family serine peptidase [Bryobacteraceae bacterium]
MNSVFLRYCLSSAILLVVPLAAQETEIIAGHQAAAHEVLVKFRTGARMTLKSDLATRHDVRQMRDLGRTGVVHMRSGSESAARLMQELSAEPDVLYAEPNYIVKAVDAPSTTPPNDPLFSQQWDMKNTGQNGGIAGADIEAVPAWGVTTGSRATVVGVVDTGVDYTHPDLKANVWSAPSQFTITFAPGDSITCPAGSHGYDAIRNTCDPMDQNNHGTHVSGTIGASGNNGAGVTGVNWTASILGLRFLDATGSGSVSNAVRAIDFAILLKAALPTAANIRVLSNSWGGSGFSQTLLDAINAANSAGILFVVAAGNDGASLDSSPTYPASYNAANEIAVAATDATDALASWSNYSRNSVQLGAPGVNIVSTVMGGSYQSWSGTSMATPHVSGAAALVLSACTLSTSALKQALLNNVDLVPALASKTATGGRLNVYRAVHSCAGQPATPGFTIGAAPSSFTLKQGASATSAISVAASGGFQGNVALSLTGLPAGVSATFNPPAVAAGGTTTLQLTASASASAGAVPLTVKGVSGSLSSSVSLSLSVTAPPGFTLSVTPSSQTVTRGGSAPFTISVAGVGGFTGTVMIQAAGVPANTSTVFTSAGAGSLKMTVATTSRTATGSYPITMTATSGSLKQTASVTLRVN